MHCTHKKDTPKKITNSHVGHHYVTGPAGRTILVGTGKAAEVTPFGPVAMDECSGLERISGALRRAGGATGQRTTAMPSAHPVTPIPEDRGGARR
jgi:glycerate-2-kinase